MPVNATIVTGANQAESRELRAGVLALPISGDPTSADQKTGTTMPALKARPSAFRGSVNTPIGD